MHNAVACSVIVATYNRSHLLVRLLGSLRTQDIDPTTFEVIVVDDGSQDDTRAVVETFAAPFAIRCISQANQGPGPARNTAILEASAEVIVSLDDDVTASPDLLRRHLAIHEKNRHAAVTGIMALPQGRALPPWIEWEARTLQQQYSAMSAGDWNPSPRQFYTANASFQKCDAIAAGLFDPQFRRAEDVELAYRLRDKGVSFHFDEDAIVYHEPNRTYEEWLRIPRLYGKYDVVMARDKDRPSILMSMVNELQTRPTLMRMAARLLVGRRLFRYVVRPASAMVPMIPNPRLRQGALSAVFNLEYWQGISGELGGGREFWRLVKQNSEDLARSET